MSHPVPTLAFLLLLPMFSSQAGVTGRYVRYEDPTEFRDFLFDLEVYSGDTAIKSDRIVEATAYRGKPWTAERVRHLVDGKLTSPSGPAAAKRPPLFEASNSPTNVCIEVDFGGPQEIDTVKVSRPDDFLNPIRLVTVLDENRKVVGSSLLTLIPGNAGNLEFPISEEGPYVGRTVPNGPGGWLPFRGMLPDHEAPTAAPEHLAAFTQRDNPENTKKLARRFFALMDLEAPHLAAVKAAFSAGQYLEALTLYRDLWFKRIADTENLWGHDIPGSYYAGEAEDLLSGRFFCKTKESGVMVNFQSGGIPWGYLPDGDLQGSFLEWNRSGALANRFARPLLTAYRKTGETKFLDLWTQATDDLCMNFSRAADAVPETDLRDYFVKETLQNWNFFLFELAETAKARPEFVSHLSPQTLARMLIFAQEEYLAPYWRTSRKTAFNHTFNALTAAYFAIESFRDFSAGQRLMRETQDHFERVLSYNTTRDGSMTEIGDDGHISMHMRLGIPLRHILATRPDWLSPQLVRQLQDRYGEMTRFQIRHLTSAGLGHRGAYRDGFDSAFLDADGTGRTYGGMAPLPMHQDPAVYRDPAVPAVLEAAFSDGPNGEAVRNFYAKESVPAGDPVVSDSMPYAGLSYLRNRWGTGASSAHMISPPVDHPSANNVEQTGLWLLGKGSAMLYIGGIVLDRESPDLELGKPLAKPGSKTERLTQSSPDPIAARWHSGRDFDLAEAVWRGPYGVPRNGLADPPFADVQTRRFLIQYRPDDFWVVVDQVAPGAETPRHYRLTLFPTTPKSQTVATEENGIRISAGNFAGLDARVFSSIPFSIQDEPKKEKTVDFRNDVFRKELEWIRRQIEVTTGAGDSLTALTVIQPFETSRQPFSVKPLSSAPAVGAGFEIDLPDGGKFAVLAAAKPTLLAYGSVSAQATLLVVASAPGKLNGLALDAKDLRINNQSMTAATPDTTFHTDAGKVVLSPILRPLLPPTISPGTPVFVDEQKVTMSTPDSDARIYFTTDGSDPVPGSPGTQLYASPVTLADTTLLKARTVRQTLPEDGIVPFRSDGTQSSIVVHAAYEKQTLHPTPPPPSAVRPGLKMEFLHDTWLRLFSFLDNKEEMPAEKSASVTDLLDPADFKNLRDGDRYFGVRYSGFFEAPQDGVYTFHLPDELARHRSAVPGYDLQVALDGKPWNPDFTWQGGGQWSVPLAKGLHPLAVTYAEARTREKISPHTGLWRGFPADHVVWKGEVPELKISGPGLSSPQRIPAALLKQP